jgi:hypothetical protein
MFLHPYEYEMLAGEVAREVSEDETARRAVMAATPVIERLNRESVLAVFWRVLCRRAVPREPSMH